MRLTKILRRRHFSSYPSANLLRQVTPPNVYVNEFEPKENREDEILNAARSHILSGDTKPIQIVRLKDVRDSVELWREHLPRVRPYYAVKCNPDPEILSLLASMNTGFDAASGAEVQSALNTGIDPSRVIYANPIKQISHLRGAAEAGVMTTTFDSLDELEKIATHHPEAKLMLRLRPDDSKAKCRLGQKFGSSINAVPVLLRRAAELNLNVIGVSFHVGSGNDHANSWRKAIDLARAAFDLNAGRHDFSVLNIGGGFSACPDTFSNIASVVKQHLDRRFPSDIQIIAEPGRFVVEKSHSLLVNVIGKRTETCVNGTPRHGEDRDGPMYFVNDGLYGSFNCVLYDHAELETPQALNSNGDVIEHEHHETRHCSVWGNTCDGLDCVMPRVRLPSNLSTGSWLMFSSMGAYTTAAASSFNGFEPPRSEYIF